MIEDVRFSDCFVEINVYIAVHDNQDVSVGGQTKERKTF